jgi:hypothetical protein
MLQFKACGVEEASPRLDQRKDPHSIQQNVDTSQEKSSSKQTPANANKII